MISNLEGEIIYLGETFEGSVHDKKMYDLSELKFPDQWHCLWVDLGFMGIEAEGVEIFMPEKKPKGKELSNFQKELNRASSKSQAKALSKI